jgi:hypothetical protein
MVCPTAILLSQGACSLELWPFPRGLLSEQGLEAERDHSLSVAAIGSKLRAQRDDSAAFFGSILTTTPKLLHNSRGKGSRASQIYGDSSGSDDIFLEIDCTEWLCHDSCRGTPRFTTSPSSETCNVSVYQNRSFRSPSQVNMRIHRRDNSLC